MNKHPDSEATEQSEKVGLDTKSRTSVESSLNPCIPPAWEAMSMGALQELLQNNADAVNFYLAVARWSHTYDDLVDQDKLISPEVIHQFVWRMLFDIPLNPFFVANQQILRPLLMTGILNWVAANEMELSGDEEKLRVAHVIRFSVGDVLLAAMMITGGIAHARKNAGRARLLIQDETWSHYLAEQKVKVL